VSAEQAADVLPWDETRYGLGLESMDATHREFAALVNRLAEAGSGEFGVLFAELIEHTRAHFAAESVLMEASGFPARAEHEGEHARVLGEMEQIGRRVQRGVLAFGRAYVRERLPEWFALHLASMDAALTVHLARQR